MMEMATEPRLRLTFLVKKVEMRGMSGKNGICHFCSERDSMDVRGNQNDVF